MERSFFILVKSPLGNQYLGRAEVTIEIQDSQKKSLARIIRQLRYTRPTLPAELENLGDISEIFIIPTQKNAQSLFMQAEDLESRRTITEFSLLSQRTKASNNDTLAIETFFLATAQISQENLFSSAAFGRSLRLGTRADLLIQTSSNSGSVPVIQWRLEGEAVFPYAGRITVEGSGESTLSQMELVPALSENNLLFGAQPASNRNIHVVRLPMHRLGTGNYRIHFIVESGKDSMRMEFPVNVVWRRMPSSLLNQDLSIDALRHIMQPDEFEDLRSISSRKQAERFQSYWHAKDNDTSEAFNPVMQEYYRRVDISNRRFSSEREPDGYRTDRGRTFILYGPPTSTERILRSGGGFSEIWYYQPLKKKYVFIAAGRNAIPVLQQIESL